MKTADGAWSRSELTLRLTKQRAANLRAIATRLPGSPTPTQALDHAIATALAAADAEPPGPDPDLLASAVQPVADQVQALSSETLSRLAAVERSLAQLLALISDALADPDGS